MVPSAKQTRRSDAWMTYSRVAQVRMSVIVPSPRAITRCAASGWSSVRSPVCWNRLLDHFVRPPQQRRRDRQAERLGGLQINDELERRHLLDRYLADLRPPQNLVDGLGQQSAGFAGVKAVGHEAAFRGKVGRSEER